MGQAVEEPSETVMSQYVVKLTKSSGGVPSNPNDKKSGKTGNKSTNND